MTKRFKFNGGNNCIEYDGKSILLDSYGEDIEELLNELSEENEQLKENCKNYEWYKQYKNLLNENEQLNYQNEMLSDELEQCKAVINKEWSKYLKKKEKEELVE